MATAISYRSESGDDYVSVYEGESIEQIVEKEKEEFGDEFAWLYCNGVASTTHDAAALEKALDAALEIAQNECEDY